MLLVPNLSMKINGFLVFLIGFLLVVLLTNLYYPLRYIKYLMPLAAMPIYFSYSRIKLSSPSSKYYFSILIFYVIIFLFLGTNDYLFSSLSSRYIPNVVFVLSPLLFLIFIQPLFKYELTKKYVLVIFYFNILIFILTEGRDFVSLFSGSISFSNALLASEFPTESNLAYVFGILLLFFILERYPFGYKLAASILLILCFKRVVMGAFAISFGMYWLSDLLKFNPRKYRFFLATVGVLINLLFVSFTSLIVKGEYDNYIYDKTGVSTDRLLMGRKSLYTIAFDQVGDDGWIGKGIGKVDDAIYSVYNLPINLHSEILRNYLEFGIIIFTLWLFVIFYQNTFSIKSFSLFVYLNVLLLTDNVFIYFDIMFYFYFIILIFLHQQEKQIEAQQSES